MCTPSDDFLLDQVTDLSKLSNRQLLERIVRNQERMAYAMSEVSAEQQQLDADVSVLADAADGIETEIQSLKDQIAQGTPAESLDLSGLDKVAARLKADAPAPASDPAPAPDAPAPAPDAPAPVDPAPVDGSSTAPDAPASAPDAPASDSAPVSTSGDTPAPQGPAGSVVSSGG